MLWPWTRGRQKAFPIRWIEWLRHCTEKGGAGGNLRGPGDESTRGAARWDAVVAHLLVLVYTILTGGSAVWRGCPGAVSEPASDRRSGRCERYGGAYERSNLRQYTAISADGRISVSGRPIGSPIFHGRHSSAFYGRARG